MVGILKNMATTDTKVNTVIVTDEYKELRLDKALQRMFPTANYTLVSKLCRKGQIRLDGKRVKGNERLEEGQELRLPPMMFNLPENDDEILEKKIKPLTAKEKSWLKEHILYQDDFMIILNKPAGMPVQAGSGHSRSIDRMMVAYSPEQKPKLVHRLDKATTGVLVFALDSRTAANLAKQFADRDTEKSYWAVVSGIPLDSEGVIDFALKKSAIGKMGREQMHASEDGDSRKAATAYTRLKRKGKAQLVEARPLTGRTHQIRAHFSTMGAPLVGDIKYGGQSYSYQNKEVMLLHARSLKFTHPFTEESITITAPLPDYFTDYMKNMGWG